MSVERLVPGGGLQITDADGDSMTVERTARVRAVVIVRTPEDGVLVDQADGLALLAFLTETLGLARGAHPEGGLVPLGEPGVSKSPDGTR